MQRYLKSDAITEVEGGGIDTCETELIESVDQFTISTDIGLWTLTGASNILQYYPNGSYGPFDSASDGYIYASNQVNRGAVAQIDNLHIPVTKDGTEIRFQGRPSNYAACDYEFYDINDNLLGTLPFPQKEEDTTTVTKVKLPLAQDSYIETIKIVVSLQTPTTGTRLIGGFAGIEVDGVKVVEGAGYATLTFPDQQRASSASSLAMWCKCLMSTATASGADANPTDHHR